MAGSNVCTNLPYDLDSDDNFAFNMPEMLKDIKCNFAEVVSIKDEDYVTYNPLEKEIETYDPAKQNAVAKLQDIRTRVLWDESKLEGMVKQLCERGSVEMSVSWIELIARNRENPLLMLNVAECLSFWSLLSLKTDTFNRRLASSEASLKSVKHFLENQNGRQPVNIEIIGRLEDIRKNLLMTVYNSCSKDEEVKLVLSKIGFLGCCENYLEDSNPALMPAIMCVLSLTDTDTDKQLLEDLEIPRLLIADLDLDLNFRFEDKLRSLIRLSTNGQLGKQLVELGVLEICKKLLVNREDLVTLILKLLLNICLAIETKKMYRILRKHSSLQNHPQAEVREHLQRLSCEFKGHTLIIYAWRQRVLVREIARLLKDQGLIVMFEANKPGTDSEE